MKSAPRVLPLVAIGLLLAAVPGRGEDASVSGGGGDERVLSFRSEIAVLPDASLAVRETIRVRAGLRRIKHGIYRDFPTRFRSSDGMWFDVPLLLTVVQRDGKPEPWRTRERENGLRAYIGDPDVLLEPGEHTYTIAYHTDRQLGFFEDHVELVWSVTGHEWVFPIDAVEARVRLPGVVSGVSVEAQTGVRGAKEHDATASWDGERGAAFRATRPFRAGEGLTAIVKWPKGFVREPAEPQLWWWYLLGSNRSALAGLAGLLLVLTSQVLVGRQVARDPGRGVVVPSREVPEGLSPAALRAVRSGGGGDERAFAATLVQMAVKGYLVVEAHGGGYTLRRGEAGRAALTPAEALVAAELRLDRGGPAAIACADQVRIGAAASGLRNFVRASLERFHVLRNRQLLLPGMALSVIVLASTLTLEPGLRSPAMAVITGMMFFWTVGVALLAVQVEHRWHDLFLHRGRRRDAGFHAASITVFALPFFLAEIVGLGLIARLGSYAYGVLLLGVALLNARFHYVLKSPAAAGRSLADRIAGFSACLGGSAGAESCRFGTELTPEVYERLLPYAIALELEEPWSRQFAQALALGRDGAPGYRPAWCRIEPAAGGWSPEAFAAAVGAPLCAAIAAAEACGPAASPPRGR